MLPSVRLVPITQGMSLGGNATELVQGIVQSVLALPAAVAPWGGYLAYIDATIVGTCAFKNAPDKRRPPEVAYFTFPGFEGRGIAKAMLTELIRIARAEKITELCAQTRPEPGASTRVLSHCGFWRRGEGVDHEIGRTWDWSLTLRTQVMGVVNVTPDSFSDGGSFLGAEAAMSHGKALALAGADVLDIGGESTRPGAQEVTVDEELRRVLPVIEGLKGVASELSIDTQKPKVALEALSAGANFVNDVSGLRDSDELARLTARFGARLCVMHMQGVPRTMQADPQYGDVVSEVIAALKQSVARAVNAGVPLKHIVADPGIGFGKTFEHNLSLLKHLHRFRELEVPILVGCSRKAFLGSVTGGKPQQERDTATAATVAISASMGNADLVRVHAVSEALDAARVGDAIRFAG